MTEIRCARCGDTDGPFTGDGPDALCEACARPVPLSFGRRLFAALTHTGPGYDLPHKPRRGDAVEQWLKAQRDMQRDRFGRTPAWHNLDDLLDAYRLHADTGTPLGEHVCMAQAVGGCDCFDTTAQ
ncbi:hypothetical protein [Streptomyces yunnanensis]|uniref:Uncharacterized protein n=1 Tax=Streptomyces yunnanensis TaxID=156453 RepID=A0A9X8MT25_9ACTN|nr:hypothetical protein [Streptomyces yunnanensis]SHL73514.1 hypothetical protein SAMN05216268_10617 [Streptomyces yunnanensis]